MSRLRIYAATTDEINQGWVWVGMPHLPQRALIRVQNLQTGHTVYCEALRIDANFLRNYNRDGRVRISVPEEALVANEWYRTLLGCIATKTDAELEITAVNDPASFVLAALHHPQVIVRIATMLGLWGIFFGIASFVLSIVSLYKH